MSYRANGHRANGIRTNVVATYGLENYSLWQKLRIFKYLKIKIIFGKIRKLLRIYGFQ